MLGLMFFDGSGVTEKHRDDLISLRLTCCMQSLSLFGDVIRDLESSDSGLGVSH
jgi:hypothetical protein